MRLALQLAWRFLKEGRTQSLLILAGVSIGVAAYVFITATMQGVQANLIGKTLGSQAHIIVLDEPVDPAPLFEAPPGTLVLREVVRPEPRQRPFDQWQRALERVEATPGVRDVVPKVAGSALAVRGGAQQAIQVIGADPARLARIVDLPGHLVDGVYRPASDQVVIGSELADDLGLEVGSTFRVRTESGDAQVRLVGVFELGNAAADSTWVVVSLRTAQSLLGRPGDITSIEATVDDLFAADTIADRVERRTGKTVSSWQERNASLLAGLSAQDQSTLMVRAFTLLSVAMGIASVLAVSVVQRRGQIGILRAMGVRQSVILGVFLWQGTLLGVVGAFVGVGLGAAVAQLLARVVPFDIVVDAPTAATALAISLSTGLLAAAWPARTASRMDPAAAIRGDG